MPRRQRRRQTSANPVVVAPQVQRRTGGNPVAAASASMPLTSAGTQVLQPQYGVPWRGRYPGSNLYGDNSTPASAYNDAAKIPDPGLPVFPPGDPVRQIPGIGLRQWNYPVGTNIAPIPRGTEGVPFPTLRALSRSYYGIGLCKRAFFRIMQRLELTFTPRPELLGSGDATSDKWLTPALKMRDWFIDGPSKRGNEDLAAWLKAVINDLLELDAVGIWPEPTRAGRLYALRYIDGSTIQCLEDLSGSTPRPPAPAYRQVVYGAPGIMLTVPTSDGKVSESQLDYLKMVTRSDGPYGLPPVEDMILTVNQALRKQAYDLRRYTDGATPEGIVTTQNAELFSLTPDQVQVYEQMWNAVLAGNDALKVRTKFLQPGFQFTSTKQQEIATEFDNFLLSIAIAMFGLTKDEVSFTETSNRAVGSSQENVTYRNAVQPTANFIAAYFTRLARRYDGQPLSVVDATISTPGSPTKSKLGTWDARFTAKWGGIEEQDDWNKKASTYIALKNAGVIGPTKVQRLLGMPLDPGEPEVPAYQIAQGGMASVVIVPDLAQHRDAMQDANNAALEAKTASSEQVTDAMKHGGMASQNGQPGQPGGGMNPVAAQALAAGKPQAAAQAANGGAHPAQVAQQQQQKVPPQQKAPAATVPQKAAAQQLGAKVASAVKAPAQGAQRARALEESDGERDEAYGRDEYRVSDEPEWAALDGDGGGVLPVSGGEPDRDGGDAVWAGDDAAGDDGGAPGVPALPGAARRGALASASAGTSAAGSAGRGGSRGDAQRTGAAGEPGGAAGTPSRIAEAAGAGTGSTAGYREAESGLSDDTRGTGGASGTAQGEHASSRHEGASEESIRAQASEDWRRWRERALKAIRAGRSIASFATDAIPADLHTWTSARLDACHTADEVRQVFADARDREERATTKGKPAKPSASDTGANHTGIMVAFLVPPEIAQQLAVPGGVAPEDHHITVAYLGDKGDYTPQQLQKMKRSVAAFAEDEQTLPDATVTGVGRFPTDADSGQYPVIAKVDAPQLAKWRDRLMNHLEADGFAPSRRFPNFTPHVTLDYVDDGKPPTATDADLPKVSIPLHTVTLAIGDAHHHTVVGNEQFGNDLEAHAKGKRSAEPSPDPLARFLDAFTAHMEAQTARVRDEVRAERAEHAEQLRELRTQVLAAIST